MQLQNEQVGIYLGGFEDNTLSKGLGRPEGLSISREISVEISRDYLIWKET
jgi:hypothetical protein